jgi:hypothetical protein
MTNPLAQEARERAERVRDFAIVHGHLPDSLLDDYSALADALEEAEARITDHEFRWKKMQEEIERLRHPNDP